MSQGEFCAGCTVTILIVRRCILVYSGIRKSNVWAFEQQIQLTATDYDALTLSPLPVSPPSFHTTIFPVVDQTILPTAETLIGRLRARHYYTDTSNFDLKCGVCGEGLIGEKGAREHAMKTGRECARQCTQPLCGLRTPVLTQSPRCRLRRVLRTWSVSEISA
jgi:hypothetical protein